MSAHILEASEGADAGLPTALPAGDAPVARLAMRECIAAPAHVRDHLILRAAQAPHGVIRWQQPSWLKSEDYPSWWQDGTHD